MTDAGGQLVPRLRFPEFTSEWRSMPMSDAYEFRGSNSLARDQLNYVSGDMKNVHYGDIHTKFPSHLNLSREKVPYVNQEAFHSSIRRENYCEAADMIFADASEDLDDIGKAIEVIEAGDIPLVAGLHTILARPARDLITIKFGGYLFGAPAIRQQIQREAQGSKVLGLSANRLRSVNLSLPKDLAEQKKIADCLSSLDAVIAAEGERLAALKAHKTGLMQQLFPAPGQTTPRLRFPKFQEGGEWKRSSLRELVNIHSGSTPSKADPEFWNGSIPWVSAKDMKRMKLDDTQDHISVAAVDNGARLVPAGTVLILTRGMTLLKDIPICVLNNEMSFNQDVKALRSKSDIDEVYLGYALVSNKRQMLGLVDIAGHGTGTLNTDKLAAFNLPYPHLAEQQTIARCFSTLDYLITTSAKRIHSLEQLKAGLLQQLFASPHKTGA